MEGARAVVCAARQVTYEVRAARARKIEVTFHCWNNSWTWKFVGFTEKVLANGMPRYVRRLADGVFDLKGHHARTDELADFVGAAVQRYRRAADRVFAVGFSNGATIMASVLLLRPDALPPLGGEPVLLAAVGVTRSSAQRRRSGCGDCSCRLVQRSHFIGSRRATG